MNDVEAGDVFNAAEQLLEELASFLLLHPLVLDDVVEQLATRSVLHYQVEFLGSLYNFIELHHLRVLNNLQNVDFPGHSLHVGYIDDLGLLEDLDSDLSLGEDVHANLDLAEGAFADCLAQDVLTNFTFVLFQMDVLGIYLLHYY